MPPQTPEQPQVPQPEPQQVQTQVQAPTNAAPTANAVDPQLQKRISNAGKSMFALGCFMTVIIGLILSLGASQNPIAQVVIYAGELIAAIVLAILGHKTKRADATQARSLITYGIVVSAAIVALGVVFSIVAHTGFLGIAPLLALITLVTLAITRAKLK